MIEKRGIVTDDSVGDFFTKEKVKYVEKHGHYIVSEEDKNLIKEPVKIEANKDGNDSKLSE